MHQGLDMIIKRRFLKMIRNTDGLFLVKFNVPV